MLRNPTGEGCPPLPARKVFQVVYPASILSIAGRVMASLRRMATRADFLGLAATMDRRSRIGWPVCRAPARRSQESTLADSQDT